MKLAVSIADKWNTLDISSTEFGPGERLSAQQAFEACRKRQGAFDGYCATAGRDPRDIQRSLLVGYAAKTPTDSLDAFHEYVGRYQEISVNEFIFSGFRTYILNCLPIA